MNNKLKRIIVNSILLILVISIIVLVGMYLGSNDFRVWTDQHILGKDITDEKLPTIDIDSKDTTNVYAYSNNVVTLVENNLTIYNKSAKKVSEVNITVSNPKFESAGDYLLIADEGGEKLYLIYNNSIQWEKDVDGQISQIAVNKSGAVGVIVTGTTYKSVIIMYDITGQEKFKTFLSTTNATDLTISEDNEYLSFIEINTSGANISSKVKTISIEKAIKTPNESLIYTYECDNNVLLLKIKYKKDKVVAFADDGVYILEKGNKKKIVNIENNYSFIDINLNGYIACVKEDTEKYELQLVNTENEKVNTYLLKDATKKIYCNDNTTAIDVGNKVEFVTNGGWLIKKFTAHQNIQNILLGKNIATIVYKDRVEILDL